MPLQVIEAGDRDPTVLTQTAVGAVGSGGLPRRTVAIPMPGMTIGRVIENSRGSREDARLALR
jgi:hypothetical protein